MMRDQRAALDRAMKTLEGSGNANAAEEEARNSKTELRSKGQAKAQLSDAAHVNDDIAAALDTPKSASSTKKKRSRRGKKGKTTPTSTPTKKKIGADDGVIFDDTPEPEKGRDAAAVRGNA